MEMHDIEKKTWLGVLVVVCVLVVGVIGTSFAYFTASNKVSGEGSSVTGTTAEIVDVTFDGGSSSLSLENAIPGDSAVSKTFSVKVSGGTTSYKINLDITSNGFTKCTDSTNTSCDIAGASSDELVYTLSNGSSTVATGDLRDLSGTQTIYTASNVSSDITYTLTIEFKELNLNQNNNMGKSLAGNIDVVLAS